mgnify:CR=1 FL=1
MKGNVIVGQSGGPTAAINSSLAGVYRTAKDRGAKKVYGMLHGIQGLLKERYIDLSEHITNELDVELLKRTPAAYLGRVVISFQKFMKTEMFMRKFLKYSTNWKLKRLSILEEMIQWTLLKNCRITQL